MPDISLFTEDLGHEVVVKTLLQRLAHRYELQINVQSLSVRHGHGKVISELEEYLRDLTREETLGIPDLLVVATDSYTNSER